VNLVHRPSSLFGEEFLSAPIHSPLSGRLIGPSLCRASGCLGTSRGSSRGTSRGSSSRSPSSTAPRTGSSSTTLPTPRVQVSRHVVRLVAPLVVDYFDYAARPSALARHAACHAVRRRLRLHRASGCLGTSRGSSRRSSSTTSPTPCVRMPGHVTRLVTPLVIDYFAYAMHPGASARRAARCRLLHVRRAYGCLGMSRGSSSTTSARVGSSSITSHTSGIRVPRHVTRLVVDHASSRRSTSRRSVALALAVRPIAPSRCSTTSCRHSTCFPVTLALYFNHDVRLRLLVSQQHRLYFEYATRRRNIVFQSHRVDHHLD
jgi:hypothetical protein